MKRWAQLLGRRAGSVLGLALAVVALAAVFGLGVFGALKGGGFVTPSSQSEQVTQLMNHEFATERTDVVVLYSSTDKKVTDPAFSSAVTRTVQALDRSKVASAITWYQTKAPPLISSDGHATQVILRLVGSDEPARSKAFDAIREHLDAPGLNTQVGGAYAVSSDVNSQVSADIARAETIAMPIVFVLSLLIFGSVAAALMPTLVGSIAVFGAFAIVRVMTGVTDVSVFSINVITLLGMGLAIDYALFIVSRFREELAVEPGRDRAAAVAAIERTMVTAGRTVFFSGTLVAACLSSLLLFDQMFLRSMGLGGIAAVLVAMGAALTVLPAVLVLLGHRIEWGSLPWRRRARHSVTERTGAWARIAAAVMRRPVSVLAAVVLAMLLLGAPFLGVKWGSVDAKVLPSSAPSRIAADALENTFPGRGPSANVVLRHATPADVTAFTGKARQVPGVQSVQPVATAAGGDRLLRVSWGGSGQSEASQQLVRDLRAISPSGSEQILVGGQTAATVDLIDSVGEKLPQMAVFVILVMFVLLFLAFGSILLPFKAIVVSVISLSASFGVVTWIFQDGHLSDLLGFTPSGYLDITQPILMLAILFGLSMDYEVFLLSRIREEWDRGHDNRRAVVAGVQTTGRIITSAAVLLAVVIGGFATSGITFIKMIGVGMLVAVLLDATVIRALLVPATMRLLGAANWWAPAPLARWWGRHGHHETPRPHNHLLGGTTTKKGSPAVGTD